MFWLLILQVAVSYSVAVYPAGTVFDRGVPSAAALVTLRPIAETERTCDLPVVAAVSPLVVTADQTTITPSWDDPGRPGRRCVGPVLPLTVGMLPACYTAPCPVYPVGVGLWADDTSQRQLLSVEPTPFVIPPECLPPLGNRAVAVFPTGITGTILPYRPNARAVQNFQLASPNSPIVEVTLRIDGVVVEPVVRGENMTSLPGWWFVMPASGIHRMSIQAVNAYGCSREVAGPVLTVP